MKIDRQRFLILTATLATGVGIAPACSPGAAHPDEPRNDPGPAVVNVTPIAPAPSAIPVATAPSSTPIASASGAPPPVAPPATPDPYKGTPVTAQACNPSLNATGSPPKCEISAPGPTCESIADTKKECPTLTKLLKPRVAEAAIECLRKRSGTQAICEFNVTSICAYEALGSACLDPSAAAVCTKVLSRCGGSPKGNYNKMSRESCEAGVSGIADAKRAKFISCISESCRFETCLTYL